MTGKPEAGAGHAARRQNEGHGQLGCCRGAMSGEEGACRTGANAEDLRLAGDRVGRQAEGMMGRGCVRGRARGGVREPPPRSGPRTKWGWGRGGREREVGGRDRQAGHGEQGERRGSEARPGVSASCPVAAGAAVLTRVRWTRLQFYHLDNLFIAMKAQGLQRRGVSGGPAFRFGLHAEQAADPLLRAQTPPRVSSARRRGTRAPPPGRKWA